MLNYVWAQSPKDVRYRQRMADTPLFGQSAQVVPPVAVGLA
jgi:hypothetical protein